MRLTKILFHLAQDPTTLTSKSERSTASKPAKSSPSTNTRPSTAWLSWTHRKSTCSRPSPTRSAHPPPQASQFSSHASSWVQIIKLRSIHTSRQLGRRGTWICRRRRRRGLMRGGGSHRYSCGTLTALVKIACKCTCRRPVRYWARRSNKSSQLLSNT